MNPPKAQKQPSEQGTGGGEVRRSRMCAMSGGQKPEEGKEE